MKEGFIEAGSSEFMGKHYKVLAYSLIKMSTVKFILHTSRHAWRSTRKHATQAAAEDPENQKQKNAPLSKLSWAEAGSHSAVSALTSSYAHLETSLGLNTSKQQHLP